MSGLRARCTSSVKMVSAPRRVLPFRLTIGRGCPSNYQYQLPQYQGPIAQNLICAIIVDFSLVSVAQNDSKAISVTACGD